MFASDSESQHTPIDDVRQIERLVRTYADICDDDYNPDGLLELFTDDPVWRSIADDGSGRGTFTGREAIHGFFSGVSKEIVFAHHIVMSPEIDITIPQREAVGRWNTIVLMKLATDKFRERNDEAKLYSAVYTHKYVNDGTGWKIAELTVRPRFDTRLRAVGG